MAQRKAKMLSRLNRDELIVLARQVSGASSSSKASVEDLIDVIGRSLSREEIEREVRQMMARRNRGMRLANARASPRLVMGLMVLIIVVSSSCVAYLGSTPPQYYLIQTSEESLGTGESVDLVYLPRGAVDADGNLIVATQSPNNSLVKFGPTGVEEWRRRFIVEHGLNAYVLSVAIDAGAEQIYVAGHSGGSTSLDRKGFLACFDFFGEVQWIRIWGSHSEAKSVAASNGSVFVAGRTGNAAPVCAFIIQYDSEGNSLWNTTWSFSESSDACAICGDADGNAYVAGASDLLSILIKYDSVGNEVWKSASNFPPIYSGKLVRVQNTYVYTLDDMGWLSRHSIDNGTLIWRKPLEWSRSRYYLGVSIIEVFSVDTFSVEVNGAIDAGGVYQRTETRDSRSTAILSLCVASFDSDCERRTNITSPYFNDQLYVGSMVLHRDGSVYVVGGIYHPETLEWEFEMMELDVVSSFLASTTLVVGLATAACIILAVLWKQKQISLQPTRR